jgi:hypothetical protein
MLTRLTQQQVEAFRSVGFVTVEGLVEAGVLQTWQAQLWEAVGADPADTPAQWRESSGATTHSLGPAVSPALHELPQVRSALISLYFFTPMVPMHLPPMAHMDLVEKIRALQVRAVAEQLGGLGMKTVSPDTETLVNFPEPTGTGWAPPLDGHLSPAGH